MVTGSRTALLVLVAFCSLGLTYPGEYPGLPAIAQYGLPTPPMQKEPWTPPRGGPGETFASAVALLFEDGLPDPRGCEYRELSAPQISLRGEMELVKTHGWVLPPGPGMATFAICWDGLIYPVLDVGKEADLEADVAAALSTEAALRAQYQQLHPGASYSRAWNHGLAALDIRADAFLPLRACFLLRLGRADLAARVWEVAVRDFGPTLAPAARPDDAFLVFAWDWTWAKYHRAIVCQNRALDTMAAADLEGLDGLGKRLQDQATARGFDTRVSALVFLNEVPALLADQQRRLGVDELIRDLENVRLVPHSVPPRIDYTESETMVQLVLHGEPAVDALVRAMETESRLSRSVTYGRPWARDWAPIPVRQLEWEAATAILGDPPVKDPAGLRRWWKANRDRPFVERLYATLADDDAGRGLWVWAAELIVRPADWPVEPLNLPPPTWPAADHPPDWMGESLRKGRLPSVSELLATRALSLSKEGRAGVERTWRTEDATRLGACMARWDPQAAREPLRALARSWDNLLSAHPGETSPQSTVSEALGDLTLARMYSKDEAALPDYARWVEAGYAVDTRPLWMAPEDASVLEATKALLGHLQSPQEIDRFRGLFAPATPMLAVEPFRARALQNLGNREAIGSVRVSESDSVDSEYRGWTGPWPEVRPTAGTVSQIRLCDSFAWNLSELPGFPAFSPFAPQAERDKAIAECVRILAEAGPRFGRAIDREAFWTMWLRGKAGSDRLLIKAVFKPDLALRTPDVSPE